MKNLNLGLSLIAMVGLGSVAFTNCSKVDFQSVPEKPGQHSLATPTFEEAVVNCSNAAAEGKLVMVEKSIGFENPKVESGRSQVCEFGLNDNLPMANEFLTARYEQTVLLPLPQNAVLCDAVVSSASSTFIYDDMFYLTFNDYVLASSLMKSVTPLDSITVATTKGDEKAYKYDWLRVRNSNFKGVNENSNNYCLGLSIGAGQCQWPNSQVNGPLSLQFDPSLVIGLGLQAKGGPQKIKFVTTGDDDPAVDCQHERLDLKVKFSYYIGQ